MSGDTVPVSYTYDSAENRISQQIGTGEETAEYLYTYDTLGQVLSETNPLEKACTYTYDYAGNVLTKTDRNGNVTQNTYGIFGISKTQIGTSVTDYSYNGIGQLMQKKLTSSQKLTDEESYTYDPFGRMTACENQDCSITNPAVVDNGYQLQYSYDKNSNLLGYTLSENQTQKSVVSYQYDQNNRLTKATLDGKIFLYQYDQNGNLLQKQGGGITTQIAYNKANLPVSYQNGTLQSYAYTYALDGNRLTDSETVSQVQKSYQYTNRGELSAETVNGATTAYTYDSRGNRLTKTGNDTAAYLYDLANRMTKETHATWYEDNSYDHAGNLSNVYHFYQSQDNPDSYNMQFWWYQYNELNQLTSYHKNGDEWTYTYNVNGLRNSKQASHGDTATFTWNGGNMIREKDSVMENIYTYGVDGVAAQKNRLWDLVYQKNAHGDVVSITNINGDTTDSYTYDAFGNQPSSAADYYKNFRFCGEYTDPETGFVYLRNRYYNPATGRFITEDPVQDGANWYSYCGGNPINRVDPSGNNWFTDQWDNIKWAFQTIGNYVNEAQKAAQRKFWKTGSQLLLRDRWSYETSAWMLEHSLQDNPTDILRGNDSRIAHMINNDSAYLSALDNAIAKAEHDKLDNYKITVQFNDGDLYYSIHKSTLYLTGYKCDDGTWIVNAILEDEYDFTEIQSFMDDGGGWSNQASKGTLANDLAVISQKTGAINSYHVTVNFWTMR